jgi:hypothetical protein
MNDLGGLVRTVIFWLVIIWLAVFVFTHWAEVSHAFGVFIDTAKPHH